MSVLLDVPIPALQGEALLGYVCREVRAGEAWRTTAKSIVCSCAPPWTYKLAICSSWWPLHCYHGRRQTVNGYVDGTLSPDWDDLGGGSDTTVRLGKTSRG